MRKVFFTGDIIGKFMIALNLFLERKNKNIIDRKIRFSYVDFIFFFKETLLNEVNNILDNDLKESIIFIIYLLSDNKFTRKNFNFLLKEYNSNQDRRFLIKESRVHINGKHPYHYIISKK